MTQQEALEEMRATFSDRAEFITLTREHSIGMHWAYDDEFYIWDHTDRRSEIMAKSRISWEHAVSLAKTNAKSIWPEDKTFEEPEIAEAVHADN